LRADGNNDDFRCGAGLFQADSLFDGDFVEWVHRHFDIGEIDPGLVRFDADFHVVIDHAFDGHEDLHEQRSTRFERLDL